MRRLGAVAAAGLGAMAARAIWRRSTQYDLRGRVALVMGGSRGLGLQLARELSSRGARIVLCARDEEELDRARQDLMQRGGVALALPCDITDPVQLGATVEEIEQAWGPVEVLINNAGIVQVGPLDDMTKADFERSMATHFWGPLHAVMAVLPSMQARGGGRIVNISSIGGKIGVPHLIPYCASKFALTGFSEALRAELSPHGIKVTTVCPGLMRTGSPFHATFKGKQRAEYGWFVVSDSLPLLTIGAPRAARKIIDACQSGRAELVLTPAAKIAIAIEGVAGGLVARAMEIAARLLPKSDESGGEGVQGKDIQSRWTQSRLTALTRAAAKANNELTAEPRSMM
jgi:NAD(P)-dependent dehydrogenase (short-subunit alcohol dehydrogenase family)